MTETICFKLGSHMFIKVIVVNAACLESYVVSMERMDTLLEKRLIKERKEKSGWNRLTGGFHGVRAQHELYTLLC